MDINPKRRISQKQIFYEERGGVVEPRQIMLNYQKMSAKWSDAKVFFGHAASIYSSTFSGAQNNK